MCKAIEDIRAEGIAIGEQRSKPKWLEEGLKKGRQEGRKEGSAIGERNGKQNAIEQTVKRMIQLGLDDDLICKVLNLSLNVLQKFKLKFQ